MIKKWRRTKTAKLIFIWWATSLFSPWMERCVWGRLN